MNIDIIKSPAKINLALDLLYKRKDGFHEIDTIMAKIDLCDTIKIKKNNILKVVCEGLPQEKNLVYRVIKELEKITKKQFNIEIEIEKKIPMGAGLAGGSSNAGTVLKYLKNRFDLNMKDVLKAGEICGSDINFFIYNYNFARCTGRGEIVIPLNIDIPYEILIIKPEVHASTPEVYKRFSVNHCKSIGINNILKNDFNDDRFINSLFNVLEKPAFDLYNDIKYIFECIKTENEGVRMSGSGASMFLLCNEEIKLDKSMNLKNLFIKKVSFWREDV